MPIDFLGGNFQLAPDFDTDAARAFTLVSAGDSDGFVVKFDPSGRLLWGRALGGYRNDAVSAVAVDPAGNVLDLTAKKEVMVLIAASWTYDGDQTGGWYPGRTSLPQLIAQGWEPVGLMAHKTSGMHMLLRRTLKTGDHVKFHTRKFNPPVAILVAANRAAMVSQLPAMSIGTNDLSGVRPPGGAFAAPGGKAVLLRTHEPDRDDFFADRGLLLRELVRQAVLLAARDELGQSTLMRPAQNQIH